MSKSMQRAMAEALAPYGRVAVWGTGSTARTAFKSWLPVHRIGTVFDSDATDDGSRFLGLPVRSPAALEEIDPECIVICADAYLEIREALQARGYLGVARHPFEWLAESAEGLSQLTCLRIDWLANAVGGWFESFVHRPQVLVNATYRLTRAAMSDGWAKPLTYPLRLIHSLTCAYFSISLPPTVEAGPGLVFPHFGGIVVNPNTRLGSFCTLYQNSTIGSNDEGGVPVLGSFVVLYTQSIVLGATRIGDHVRIGARAFVDDMEIDSGTTVVGHPAKAVRRFTVAPSGTGVPC